MIKNRMLYIMVLAVSLLFIYLYKGDIVYITLYSVILLPVVSFIIAYMSKWMLEIRQDVDKGFIIKGEEVTYTLSIHNKSIFPFTNISFVFIGGNIAIQSDAKPVTVQLGPRATVNIPVKIQCRYRGTYEIGLKSVELLDYLGLFKFKHSSGNEINITVCPKVIEIVSFPLAMNLLSKADSRHEIREEDYTSVTDVRKYEPTDSYKKIHWKLTAKKNDLIVKNFQSTVMNSTVIILDTRVKAVDARHAGIEEQIIVEDKQMETFVSIANYCLMRQLPVEVIFGGSLKHSARNSNGFDDLYAIATELVFEGENGPEIYLYEYLADQTNYINIIILTATLSEQLYEGIVSAGYFGHYVSLIYFAGIKADTESDGIFERLKEIGSNCYLVRMDSDINEIF